MPVPVPGIGVNVIGVPSTLWPVFGPRRRGRSRLAGASPSCFERIEPPPSRMRPQPGSSEVDSHSFTPSESKSAACTV